MSDETTTAPAEQSEPTVGVGMLMAAFVDERAAENALQRMREATLRGEFYYDGAAVLRCDDRGKVHISETGDMSAGKGAGIGALIGGVIGLLGGPAGVAIGAGTGAALGGLAAHRDAGFSTESLREIGGALLPGTSAVVTTTSQRFVEKVRQQAPPGETLSMAREIATDIREKLKLRQDVLYILMLTETGLSATQVVSSPTMLAVFGIAVDEETVAMRQAVATPQGIAYEAAVADADEAAYEAGVATAEGAVVVDVDVKTEGEAPKESVAEPPDEADAEPSEEDAQSQ